MISGGHCVAQAPVHLTAFFGSDAKWYSVFPVELTRIFPSELLLVLFTVTSAFGPAEATEAVTPSPTTNAMTARCTLRVRSPIQRPPRCARGTQCTPGITGRQPGRIASRGARKSPVQGCFFQVFPASSVRQSESSKPTAYAVSGALGAKAIGPNMTVDFIASFHVLPPSFETMIPSLDMRIRLELPGWTAYSMTMRPPFESVNGVFVQDLALLLICEPASMSPLTK